MRDYIKECKQILGRKVEIIGGIYQGEEGVVVGHRSGLPEIRIERFMGTFYIHLCQIKVLDELVEVSELLQKAPPAACGCTVLKIKPPEQFVKRLNEDVTITLKRHEVVRLGQIVGERLEQTPESQYEYERGLWEKLQGV